MRIAFIADPLESFKIYKDSTFAMMEAADLVLFMQDYQDSRGAMLEWAWCQYVGKQTCFDLAAFGGPET